MHDDQDATDDAPSKSALKRESHALQALGERLVALPEAQLKRIPIEDETLAEAIELARNISARGGLRRQLQFIGKLMRRIDTTDIDAAFAALDGQQQAANARFHRLEQWRDELLEQGDKALGPFVEQHPAADRSRLRQMLRQHQKSRAAGKPSTVPKALFRYLRELDHSDG